MRGIAIGALRQMTSGLKQVELAATLARQNLADRVTISTKPPEPVASQKPHWRSLNDPASGAAIS